ncbi:DUF1304 domain-containing protein [Pengzhenrongella sicca]|uniref:DUF1304 domain-containing protein n=1 Tax=Pengzhenrongella sicca TaxID=2819238 RepID=A0A8A4ZI53_9MICO|nr:DUF1304 domain-containing protein [Pengzhenrongella sicca]
MLAGLPAAAAAFAVLAGLVHVYIFVLESLLWTTPRTRATFGTTERDADTTRDLAYNQGFYNLFLGIGAIAGVALAQADDAAVGAAGVGVMLFATASMVAAALVLVLRAPAMARAALVQGLAPLLAIALAVAL